MAATLGDLLRQAAGHLGDAAVPGTLTATTVLTSARQLSRITTAMTRYVMPPATSGPASDPWAVTAAAARTRLAQATASLRRVAALLPSGSPASTHPLPRGLASTAEALSAGADLLATHFTTGREGGLTPCSYWATSLISPPATAALCSELAFLSGGLARACDSLASTVSPAVPGEGRAALADASAYLRAMREAVTSASSRHPVPPGYRELLHALSSAIPPVRQPAREPEQPTSLYAGIAISAERLRTLAPALAADAAWSPQAAAGAWRWAANAVAAAGHTSELILATLAQRAAELTLGNAASALPYTIVTMNTAWTAWRQVASAWGGLVTDTPESARSPLAGDLSDLLLRLGRLAYANPAWSPAYSQHAPPRLPADLAPGQAELRAAVSAAHHMADVLTRLAAADLDAVRAAADAGRLFIPARLATGVPAGNTHALLPAPPDQVTMLLDAYRHAGQASSRAAIALDMAAITLEAPSRILATVRQTTRHGDLHADYDTGYAAGYAAGHADAVRSAVSRTQNEEAPAWQHAFPQPSTIWLDSPAGSAGPDVSAPPAPLSAGTQRHARTHP